MLNIHHLVVRHIVTLTLYYKEITMTDATLKAFEDLGEKYRNQRGSSEWAASFESLEKGGMEDGTCVLR